LEIPEAEGNLGMYIYDFFYEREEPNPLQKEKQKESFRVTDPGCQPSPKKMKTQHERKDDSAKKKNQEAGGSIRDGAECGRNILKEDIPNLLLGKWSTKNLKVF
jgi:hypothetical protein